LQFCCYIEALFSEWNQNINRNFGKTSIRQLGILTRLAYNTR